MSSTLVDVAVHCAHCGLPAAPAVGDGPAFCCAGCATAWEVIHTANLTSYYAEPHRRDRPVTSSGRQYEELDDPAFQRLYVKRLAGNLLETELYLDGVHCASCVWLIERVPVAVPGALSAELNVGRSMARVRWAPSQTTLSAIARWFDRLGYPAHPFRGASVEKRRQQEDRRLLAAIGVAGAIAINVMTVALALYAGWFGGMEASLVRFFRWVSLGLTVPSLLWPGRVFFTGALGALRTRRLNMDVPIALALGAGALRGAINTIADSGPIYFDGVVTLVFLLLVGRFLQQRAQRTAADSAELLQALTPSTATVVDGDRTRILPVEALLPGMVVLVRAGDSIPADGIVASGETGIDQSMLTGESLPVPAVAGDRVFAGTLNVGAAIRVTVEQAGDSTRLGQMLRSMEDGAARRAPVVQLADRLAGWFVGAVLILAVVTWFWWRRADPASAPDNAIALLIVTCPCALALATPLAMSVAIGRAAKRGILIRSARALEILARPTVLVFDKTGTLTEGRFAVLEWRGDPSVRAVLKGLEAHATHPIAGAIRSAWPELAPEDPVDVQHTVGGGLQGWHGGHQYRVGSPTFVLSHAADTGLLATLPPHLTPVLVARDGEVVAALGLGDPVRPDSGVALAALQRRGYPIGVLSGDAPGVVEAAVRHLGVTPSFSLGEQGPEAKAARVRAAARHGAVAMIGDGVNDAPAIGHADVGIGVRGGAEACLAAADVFLTHAGVTPVVDLVDGSRRTMRLIRWTIAVSVGYNIIGAALAMTGTINPLIAAVMMPVSSVTAVLLSCRGRTFDAP